MKIKHIFFFCFNFGFILGLSQETKISKKVKWKYEPNLMIGIDILGAGLSFVSERKVYQGFLSSKIKKDLHALADVGFERNTYDKNGYLVDVSGLYLRIGTVYMLIKDPENEINGFYGGGKLAASHFQQEYKAVPVRGFAGSDSSISFSKSSQNSFWVEANIGGRIQLFESKFYIDMNLQPKYLIFTTKQEEIQPMIIPGFGKSSGKFNLGLSWNLGYYF